MTLLNYSPQTKFQAIKKLYVDISHKLPEGLNHNAMIRMHTTELFSISSLFSKCNDFLCKSYDLYAIKHRLLTLTETEVKCKQPL